MMIKAVVLLLLAYVTKASETVIFAIDGEYRVHIDLDSSDDRYILSSYTNVSHILDVDLDDTPVSLTIFTIKDSSINGADRVYLAETMNSYIVVIEQKHGVWGEDLPYCQLQVYRWSIERDLLSEMTKNIAISYTFAGQREVPKTIVLSQDSILAYRSINQGSTEFVYLDFNNPGLYHTQTIDECLSLCQPINQNSDSAAGLLVCYAGNTTLAIVQVAVDPIYIMIVDDIDLEADGKIKNFSHANVTALKTMVDMYDKIYIDLIVDITRDDWTFPYFIMMEYNTNTNKYRIVTRKTLPPSVNSFCRFGLFQFAFIWGKGVYKFDNLKSKNVDFTPLFEFAENNFEPSFSFCSKDTGKWHFAHMDFHFLMKHGKDFDQFKGEINHVELNLRPLSNSSNNMTVYDKQVVPIESKSKLATSKPMISKDRLIFLTVFRSNSPEILDEFTFTAVKHEVFTGTQELRVRVKKPYKISGNVTVNLTLVDGAIQASDIVKQITLQVKPPTNLSLRIKSTTDLSMYHESIVILDDILTIDGPLVSVTGFYSNEPESEHILNMAYRLESEIKVDDGGLLVGGWTVHALLYPNKIIISYSDIINRTIYLNTSTPCFSEDIQSAEVNDLLYIMVRDKELACILQVNLNPQQPEAKIAFAHKNLRPSFKTKLAMIGTIPSVIVYDRYQLLILYCFMPLRSYDLVHRVYRFESNFTITSVALVDNKYSNISFLVICQQNAGLIINPIMRGRRLFEDSIGLINRLFLPTYELINLPNQEIINCNEYYDIRQTSDNQTKRFDFQCVSADVNGIINHLTISGVVKVYTVENEYNRSKLIGLFHIDFKRIFTFEPSYYGRISKLWQWNKMIYALTTINGLETLISYKVDYKYTIMAMPLTYNENHMVIVAEKDTSKYMRSLDSKNATSRLHHEFIYMDSKLKRIFKYSWQSAVIKPSVNAHSGIDYTVWVKGWNSTRNVNYHRAKDRKLIQYVEQLNIKALILICILLIFLVGLFLVRTRHKVKLEWQKDPLNNLPCKTE